MTSNGSVFAFWLLNHRLEKNELRRQLMELKSRGFAGVLPHARAGLQTPYLSRAWFDAIRFIAGECRRLNLEFWLYDEDPFPSGAAGGRVMLDHPEFIRRTLVFEEHATACAGGAITVDFAAQKLVGAYALLLDDGRPSKIAADLTADCGLVRKQWTELRRTTNGYYKPYKNTTRAHWRTGTTGIAWRLQSRLPPGKYLIVGVFSQIQPYNTWGTLPDLINPAAVEYFMKITHARYRRELGAGRFARVRGIFTDEPKVTGDFPWTDSLPEQFRRAYGADILPLLPHLKYELDDQTDLVRHRYRRLLGHMFRAAFTKPISRWCAKNGIQSTGHFSPEENPIGQQAMTPDLMGWLKDMHMPGIDLIGSNIGTRPYSIINIGPKLVCSAARQAGRPQVLSESLAVCGDDLSLARAKSMLDWQMVMGVNKFVLHGQYYSLDGPRKRDAPPSIFQTAPYWPYFNKLADYLEDTCRLLRRGRRICDLAVLYPTAHINAVLPGAETALSGWRKALGDLVYRLLARGFDFDFVAEPDLADARSNKAGLRIGRCYYKALIVPGAPALDAAAAAALRRLRLPVIFAGPQPRILGTSRRLPAIGRTCRAGNLETTLAAWIKRPLTTASGKDLFCHSRTLNRKTYHFVFNPAEKRLRCRLATAAGKWLEIRDDQSGAFRPMDPHATGGAALDLPPTGAALLRESEAGRAVTIVAAASKPRAINLRHNWTLKLCGDNTLMLDAWRSQDGRLFHLPLPGQAPQLPPQPLLRARFYVKSLPPDAYLVWEEGGFAAPHAIALNGQRLIGRPRRVFDAYNLAADVTRLLRPGWNTVKVSFQAPGAPPMHDPLRLMGNFRVSAHADGWLIENNPAEMRLRALADWTRLGWPFYSGTMIYSNEFELPALPDQRRKLLLQIDGVHDLAEPEINGKSAGVLAWPPYQCDISRLVRPGRNRLRLRVANSAVNFIGGEPSISGIAGNVKIFISRHAR